MQSARRAPITKFLVRIRKLISDLDKHRSYHVHKTIDQFYYMQKAEEISFLNDQAEEGIGDPMESMKKLNAFYGEVYCKWRKDVRWLNRLT